MQIRILACCFNRARLVKSLWVVLVSRQPSFTHPFKCIVHMCTCVLCPFSLASPLFKKYSGPYVIRSFYRQTTPSYTLYQPRGVGTDATLFETRIRGVFSFSVLDLWFSLFYAYSFANGLCCVSPRQMMVRACADANATHHKCIHRKISSHNICVQWWGILCKHCMQIEKEKESRHKIGRKHLKPTWLCARIGLSLASGCSTLLITTITMTLMSPLVCHVVKCSFLECG